MEDIKILIIDDEKSLLEDIKEYLKEYNIFVFPNPRDALELIKTQFFHIIIVDYKMPGISGVTFLLEAKKLNAYFYGILFTAFADKELLEQLFNKKLISRFIDKPVKLRQLKSYIDEGIAEWKEKDSTEKKLKEYETFIETQSELIGLKNGLKEVFDKCLSVARYQVPVLLTGETGTGKEMIAKLIHQLSYRRDNTFVEVNCAAIPMELLESELFGHQRGAFTGAVAAKSGKIEKAHKGTLFLDEIGDMKPDLQAKLLRVLQDRKIHRLGSVESKDIDFRLIAATNKNLHQLCLKKEFREDLYYRINTYPIHLPPLRQRKEDIEELVHHYFNKYTKELNAATTQVTPRVIEMLKHYHWPGNIRELMNAIRRALITGQTKESLEPEDFEFLFITNEPLSSKLEKAILVIRDHLIKNKTPLKEMEEKILDAVLSFFDHKISRAVEGSGIPKDKFYRNRKKNSQERKK